MARKKRRPELDRIHADPSGPHQPGVCFGCGKPDHVPVLAEAICPACIESICTHPSQWLDRLLSWHALSALPGGPEKG